jgi:hypothetical protein
MVRPFKTLPAAAIAAAATIGLMGDSVSALPFKYLPTTTVTTTTLGKDHPAFGGPQSNSSTGFTVVLGDAPDLATLLSSVNNVTGGNTTMLASNHNMTDFVVTSGVSIEDEDEDDDGSSDYDDDASDYDDSEDTDACDPGFGSSTRRKLKERKFVRRSRTLEESSTDVQKLETYFGESMEMRLKKLPTTGVFDPAPWPGPYWPMYQDGINVIWSLNEPSAAEKYATAFDLDVTEFMNNISSASGIDAESSNTVCTTDDDCTSESSDSVCAIRTDQTSGYCIPTWYGICHAWTPAAILEDEPQCSVTYNGVTFQVLDLKALVTQVYDGADVETVFTGVRYNGESDSTDEYGRHTNSAYRDLGPGFFHVAITNILGRYNQSFIIDYAADADVWNQPVRGFNVKQQTRYTLEEAGETFYSVDTYPFNDEASSIVYVKTRLSWIYETYTDGPLVSTGKVDSYTTGAYYTYLLEMDEDDKIIGGEWIWDSDDTHPDFLWFPTGKPADDTVTEVGLSYANVRQLLESAQNC